MKMMRMLIKGNIKFYKKYTVSMLLGIILSVSLLTGISSMIYSNEKYTIKQNRTSGGDYHYSLKIDDAHYQKLTKNLHEDGFKIDKYGMFKKKGMVEVPYMISFVYGDEGFLSISNREIIEGHYPISQEEIALSASDLINLRVQRQIGQLVNIDQKQYILTGIISDKGTADTDSIEAFVNNGITTEAEETYVYIKFDEQRSVKEQKAAFCKEMNLPQKALSPNFELTQYFGDKAPSSLYSLLKEGMRTKELNFTGILLLLKDTTSISTGMIIAIFGVFCAFILYSILNISTLKRMTFYEILQAIGADFQKIYLSIMGEILVILAIGYPLGAICGNLVSKYLYPIFSNSNVELESDKVQYLVNWNAIVQGAVFFVFLSMLISGAILLKIIKHSTKKNNFKTPKSKEKSDGRTVSTKIILRLTFEKKGMFVGIVISLSLGAILFLATNYIIKNTQNNNELTLKADDGLGSDYQVYLETTNLGDGISPKVLKDLTAIEGVEETHPVRYYFGEVQLKENELSWKTYFPEIADIADFRQSPRLIEFFNGICVKKENGYGIKSNIYGYDREMVEALEDYIVDGDIAYQKMEEKNQVILRTLEGGQNNYGGIDIQPGDKIKVKVPTTSDLPSEVVKFKDNVEWYEEKEFVVCATVKRVMAKNQYFIGDSGLDLVMTNRQMKDNFGLTGYNQISINQKSDALSISNDIVDSTIGTERCLTKDYTQQIRTANVMLQNKASILYAIAIIILLISLLHIVNSISYLIAEREYEFGVLRAIGIEDIQLVKIILVQGFIYGLAACAITVVGYKVIEYILRYILVSTYSYISILQPINLWLFIGALCMNLLVAITSMIMPIRHIISENILKQIKK